MCYPIHVPEGYSAYLIGEGEFVVAIVFSTEKRRGGLSLAVGPAARPAHPEQTPQPFGLLGTMPSILAECCIQRGAAVP